MMEPAVASVDPVPVEDIPLPTPEPLSDQPTAVQALVAAYTEVAETAMKDVFICNPNLSVEAVGFRAYQDGLLGILITPWFINLMIIGDEPEDETERLSSGQKRKHGFPSGQYEFITSDVDGFGRHQSLSLFSPAMEFESQVAARLTALECLKAVFLEDAKDDSLDPGENLPLLGIKDLEEAEVNSDNATPVDPAWFDEDGKDPSMPPKAQTSVTVEKALDKPLTRRDFLRRKPKSVKTD